MPRLLSRSVTTWLVLGLTVLGVGAVVGGYAVASGRPVPAAALGVVVVLAAGWVGMRSTGVDPEAGEVVRRLGRVTTRRVPLGGGTTVALRDNRVGALLLEVRPPGHRPTYLEVLRLDSGGDRCQAPELLDLLATTVERHQPAAVRTVAGPLRAQADHVRAGGALHGSPLANRVRRAG